MILYLDPFSGIAGDMFCAALLDAGLPLEAITEPLQNLPLDGYKIVVSKTQRGAFSATLFDVQPDTPAPENDSPASPSVHSHDHGHGHDHSHSHSHSHGPHPAHWPGQPDRRWCTIREMLEQADLPAGARRRALAVFSTLAAAEAAVHGVSIDDVHFHEVGAVDSIVDIVSACLALDALGVERIISGPPPLSTGTITGAHGLIPLPAPATLHLLRGWPIRSGVRNREEVTPTGAAILSALATPGPLPAMVLHATGCGAGQRDPKDKANIVRVMLGAPRTADSAREVVVLQAQMDDLTGEHLPTLIDALLNAGAVDAHAVHTLMKKGRAGHLVTALCVPDKLRDVEDAFLRHGSTFGVRHHTTIRRVLDRHHEPVKTPWGTVRIKVGRDGEETIHASPEHEDVLAVARAAGVSAPRVYAAAVAAWHTDR